MRFSTLVISAAASVAFAGALAGAAQAQALDEEFRSLCVAHKGQATPILAAADAAGWTALPAGATPPQLPGGGTLKSYAIRLHAAGGSPRLLVVGEGSTAPSDSAPSVPLKICFVASTQPDPQSLANEKAALKGEPMLVQPPAAIYLVDQNTGLASPLKGDAAAAKLKAGGMATVMVLDAPQATAFGYQVTQPAPLLPAK